MRADLLLFVLFCPLFCHAKGGGGGGHGSSSHGSSGHSSSGKSTSGGRSSSSQSTVSTPSLTNGGSTAKVSGSGGDEVSTIKSGPFAGRTSGGGTRGEVYGDSYYGSGYPGYSGLGVADRSFPFNFYPVVWQPPSTYYYPPYIYSHNEYGEPENTTRPGGPLVTVVFQGLNNTAAFRFMADNATVAAITTEVVSSCGSLLANFTPAPSPYLTNGTIPLPEQAIQYYRGSSAVLTEDGYNNTAIFSSDPSASPTPLPANVDSTLLNCLNSTIGTTIPLVQKHSNTKMIISAVFGSIAGLFLLCYIMHKLDRLAGCCSSRRWASAHSRDSASSLEQSSSLTSSSNPSLPPQFYPATTQVPSIPSRFYGAHSPDPLLGNNFNGSESTWKARYYPEAPFGNRQ